MNDWNLVILFCTYNLLEYFLFYQQTYTPYTNRIIFENAILKMMQNNNEITPFIYEIQAKWCNHWPITFH